MLLIAFDAAAMQHGSEVLLVVLHRCLAIGESVNRYVRQDGGVRFLDQLDRRAMSLVDGFGDGELSRAAGCRAEVAKGVV